MCTCGCMLPYACSYYRVRTCVHMKIHTYVCTSFRAIVRLYACAYVRTWAATSSDDAEGNGGDSTVCIICKPHRSGPRGPQPTYVCTYVRTYVRNLLQQPRSSQQRPQPARPYIGNTNTRMTSGQVHGGPNQNEQRQPRRTMTTRNNDNDNDDDNCEHNNTGGLHPPPSRPGPSTHSQCLPPYGEASAPCRSRC